MTLTKFITEIPPVWTVVQYTHTQIHSSIYSKPNQTNRIESNGIQLCKSVHHLQATHTAQFQPSSPHDDERHGNDESFDEIEKAILQVSIIFLVRWFFARACTRSSRQKDSNECGGSILYLKLSPIISKSFNLRFNNSNFNLFDVCVLQVWFRSLALFSISPYSWKSCFVSACPSVLCVTLCFCNANTQCDGKQQCAQIKRAPANQPIQNVNRSLSFFISLTAVCSCTRVRLSSDGQRKTSEHTHTSRRRRRFDRPGEHVALSLALRWRHLKPKRLSSSLKLAQVQWSWYF